MLSKALPAVDNAENSLKIKGVIALFIQTMDVSYDYLYLYWLTDERSAMQTWGFPVGPFDNFLLALFEKYAELLKRRFSDDFQEVHALTLREEFILNMTR
jgi:hypothetical protein